MLNFHKFILLSSILFSSVCYGMEGKNILNNENIKNQSNKQVINNGRSKSFNNYPEKKSFFKNNINENKSNINDNKNNNKSNNETNDSSWNIIKEVTDENNNLKCQIDLLKEENNNLIVQNEKVQQKIIELTNLVSELQKQIKNNNVEQTQDTMQCNDCDNNTIMSAYTQYANLQEYNISLLNFIDNITNQLQLLEAENARKDKRIKYRDWRIGCKDNKIKYLLDKNKRLYSSLKVMRSRSNSVRISNSYNNLSSYSNYNSYRNIDYNNASKNKYNTQKESKKYNQLHSQQIKDLEQGNNQNENNNQSNNDALDHQINNNQNSAINIINNINNNKKHIIQNEEEANQIFGSGIVCKSNIQNTQNIIGLNKGKLKNTLRNKKRKNREKNKKENNNMNNNNINIINTEEINIKEEKQIINIIDEKESIENDNINNEEYKKEDVKYEDKREDIKEDGKVYDNDKEDKKVDDEQDDLNNFNEIKNDLNNINILKNGLTDNNNLNNNINLSDNGKNIKDDLTVITEQDDNFTVITDYNIKKNRKKKKNKQVAKDIQDKQFYDAFSKYENNIEEDKQEIIKELELKKQQIIQIGGHKLNIGSLRNTDDKYFQSLENNIAILKNFSKINKSIKNDIDIKAYTLFTVYKVIELQEYNDMLRENNLKNGYLLNFTKGNEIIKDITKFDYIYINGLMSRELYFNALKKDLFVKNSIKWPGKYMKTAQNILKHAKPTLIQFFVPIISYGLSIETIDEHVDNTLDDKNKRYVLMKHYLKFFLNKIKKENAFIKTLNNKELISDFNRVVNIFKYQLVEIINIIKNNEFNKCANLIDELSEKVESELLSQYCIFYKLYLTMMNIDNQNISKEIKEESLNDCVDFVNKVNDTKMIKELIDTITA